MRRLDREGMPGGSGLWPGGWQCQAGTEGLLPASAPPPGSELPSTQLSLGPRRACLSARGWAVPRRTEAVFTGPTMGSRPAGRGQRAA